MTELRGAPSILVVDDKPEAILAIEAALTGLSAEIVRAGSGRDALRHVLRQSFAVILLDINMPNMDGFETAELVRRHKNAAHTPIIFLTASGDDVHLYRGYALGAVDFIVTPIHADVLRTKVSVFVDLFRATERVRQQAESLRARATQLHKLTRASLSVSSASSIEGIVRAVAESARDVIGAHQALALLSPARPDACPVAVTSFSDRHAGLRERGLVLPASFVDFARERNAPFRLDARELHEHAAWLVESGDEPPLRGCLVAPLTDVDGRNMGLVLLSDRAEGDFSDDDEAVLVQLAQLGTVAVQNALHAASREANRNKEELLAVLSHELRTPLNAILGWTRILRSGAPDADKLARGLEVIERNVNAQNKLIEELLDISRIESGKLDIEARRVALGPVVQAAVDAARPAAE
ncbi:diguanylate cyclase/phosphodiesterase (GGDEF & EAL domains) with PAS/PAC sensor [Minicystis rosea]|nr:diguanylate cyclase/phosphodiesterase (GGDEF & EAL domains) with PAS/PAC sensor [Minicystis rosea]